MSSAKRKSHPEQPQPLENALRALKAELEATNLLALNATIRSAQNGTSGEELFAALREIRDHAKRSLDYLARHEARATSN